MSSTIDFVPARNDRNKAVAGPIIVRGPRGLKRAHIGGPGGNRVSRWLTFLYSFDVQGGAVSAITLTDEEGAAFQIPANAMILRVRTECVKAATSAGAATIGLGVTGTAAMFLAAATAYTDNKYDTVGEYGAAEAALPTNAIDAATSVLATIGAAALTAGKFKVHIEILEAEVAV